MGRETKRSSRTLRYVRLTRLRLLIFLSIHVRPFRYSAREICLSILTRLKNLLIRFSLVLQSLSKERYELLDRLFASLYISIINRVYCVRRNPSKIPVPR